MNKYIAKTVFQIVSGKGDHTPQFDEQLRIIEAKDEREALRKAREKGRSEEDVFQNNHNETVRWKFIEVTDLLLLNNLGDGAEIYSRIEEADDAARYITVAKQKARTIETLSNFVFLF